MNFAVLIDKNYISRLDLLIYSLNKHCNFSNFFVVALDNFTFEYYKCRKQIITLKIDDIHLFYPELDSIKQERDYVSYIFTLSPFFPLYILENFIEIDNICTLDADQFFFSNPKPIFDLLDFYSVLITPHRFTDRLLKGNYDVFGRYNVSFQIFKNDKVGIECLELWKNQCLEWCFDKVEDELYADQKYLDTWKSIFGNSVYEIENKGVGLAPWNFEDLKIDKRYDGVYVNDDKLVLYHYQGLRVLENGIVYTFLDNYAENNLKPINKFIYKPIIYDLLKFTIKVDSISRNKLIFDEEFLIKKSSYFFKRKYNLIFQLNKYQHYKDTWNAIINRFKYFF